MKIVKWIIAVVLLLLTVAAFSSGASSVGYVLLVIIILVFFYPQAKAREDAKKRQIDDLKTRAAESGLACCPKCGSTSLSANKKGFGAGKAAAGVILTGGALGLAAGGIGSKKITITCLNCGYKFKPGQRK